MSHSTEKSSPFGKPVRVLVVDDDTTCLSIVDGMLKRWNYEVVAVKHPIDALRILRTNSDSFDLVVLDVYMPEMNGFELQQLITQEFNLPVVLMSADDKDAMILKGIDGGAAYFISKPVTPDDIRDLWQYAALKRSSDDNGNLGKGKEKDKGGNGDGNEYSSVNIIDQDGQHGKELKRKYTKRDSVDDSNDTDFCNNLRKQKVVWSSELHNRFLEAISNIGLDRAVPKKILEEMNVPGLTRENVASHLQKYRIFLKRLADLNSVNCTREKSLSDRFLRSSFMTSKNPTLTFRQQQMRTFYSRGYERYSSNNSVSFPILETSNTNLLSSGRAQSSLSSNQGISIQMYKPATQATSSNNLDRSTGLEFNYSNLTKFGVGSTSGSGFVTAGTSNHRPNLIQNPNNYFGNSNYVGLGIVNDTQTSELGQMGFINYSSNGFILNKGTVPLVNTDHQSHGMLNSATSIPAGNVIWNNGSAGGQVDFDALFGNLMNNTYTASTSNNILPQTLQPYDSGNDFTDVAIHSSNGQEQDGDDADFWSSFDSFHIGDMDVPMVEQFSKEQQAGADPMMMASNSNSSSSSNSINPSFPWINQNHMSQRDDEAFLDSVLSIDPTHPDPAHMMR